MNLQGLIRQANSSFMKELLFDYEPLQALISMYNDQFLGSPQLQINVNFQSSNDVIAMIHNVASSDWFTSIETSGDKEGLTKTARAQEEEIPLCQLFQLSDIACAVNKIVLFIRD